MKTRSAEKIQKKLVTLIYGPTFSGKTTLGLQLAYFKRNDDKPFRVAVVDAEGGGVDDAIDELIDNGVDVRNLHVFYTQSLMEVSEILKKIKEHEVFYEYDEDGNETDEVIKDADGENFFPDAILIDGTSVLKLTSEQGLLELSKKRNTVKADKDGLLGAERFVKIQGADLEFKDYKKLNYSGQNLVLDLMAIGINVVLTAREKDETVQKQDKNGNPITVATGDKIFDSFKGMDYNCKTTLRTFIDKETGQICAEVRKDRTRVHKAKEILEDPNLLDWQQVISENKDKKVFILKNDLDKAVESEQKMYEKEAMQLHSELVENSTEKPSEEDSIDSLKKQIIEKKNSLPQAKKNLLRDKLVKAKLPLAYKNVMDIEILKQVLDVMNS